MKLGFISVLLGGGVYIACFKCKEYISMLNYQLLIIAKLVNYRKKITQANEYILNHTVKHDIMSTLTIRKS